MASQVVPQMRTIVANTKTASEGLARPFKRLP